MDFLGAPERTDGSPQAGVQQLSAALDLYPAGFSGNPLNLLLVENIARIGSPKGYLEQLAAPSLMAERREYFDSGDFSCWPFPVLSVRERPDPWSLSHRLFERFEEANQMVPAQREVSRILEERVKRLQPDIVALMIVDGLSYYDLPANTDAEPLLVDGVTITEYGYREVVGNPQISRRLFALGYQQQRGYTYYVPDPGELAGALLATFSISQTTRVSSFEEILANLREANLTRGYVQIAAPGLDELSHAHHDVPPREHYLKETMARFERLVDCLAQSKRRVLACLTADHGILWREVLEGRAEVVTDLFSEDAHSPRYIKGNLLRPYARPKRCLGRNYTLLRLPYLTRKLRNNEWGVHGGISAWESVVPLLLESTAG